ncbi:group III truncated hemoglobin [Puniceicoccaceae bacterium K14]|nr:group III truncated hemoglobin [Puniceicoccaceae bacterium K14]
MKTDIEGRAGVERMVDSFYEKIRKDSLLGPLFDSIVSDWSAHLPTMYSFWESMLFRKGTYQGNPFAKHVELPLQREHFAQWLVLFEATLDELFSGPVTEHARGAAKSIAHSFQIRMGIAPFSIDGRVK